MAKLFLVNYTCPKAPRVTAGQMRAELARRLSIPTSAVRTKKEANGFKIEAWRGTACVFEVWSAGTLNEALSEALGCL
jgi:hypothetical protein